jgi:hypothetical protein
MSLLSPPKTEVKKEANENDPAAMAHRRRIEAVFKMA